MPAAARAAQVEMQVRFENATGQAIHDRPVQQITSVALNTTIAGAQHQIPLSAAVLGQFNLTNPGISAPQTPNHNSNSPEPQIVRGVSALVNQRGGVMNMRLDPPELGSLRIQMTIVSGNVTAEFQPSSQQAHALLEKSMPMLRTALEAQGLTIDRLSVHVAHAASQGSGAQLSREDANHAGQSHQHRSSHDAGNGESRGRGDHQPNDQRPRVPTDAAFEEIFGFAPTPTTNN